MHKAFPDSFKAQYPDSYKGMTAVCIEPYHELAYPIMVVIPD